MFKNQIKVAIISCILLMVTGCARTQPIYNFSEPIGTSPSNISSTQMDKIIVSAAHEQGWKIRTDGPKKYKASVAWKDHSAVAEISYTKSQYNINLLSSQNLLEGNGMIHKRYNQRVQMLKDTIDSKIAKSSAK